MKSILLLSALFCVQAVAQLTTVSGTIYLPSGTKYNGQISCTWPVPFVGGDGRIMPAGPSVSTQVQNGALSIQLEANDTATPSGTYYTCSWRPTGSATIAEVWIVPYSASPVSLEAVRQTTVPPFPNISTLGFNALETGTNTQANMGVGAGATLFPTSTGVVQASRVGSKSLVAAYQSGSDCGAKINSAVTALGGPGEILVNQDCGTTWTTAVSLAANTTLRFIQGGTYTSSGAITKANNSCIVGTGRGNIAGSAGTELKEANGVNLAAFIINNGYGNCDSNIYYNCNKANNSSALDCITVAGAKYRMDNVGVENGKRHNLAIGGSTQETIITRSSSAGATNCGISFATGASDASLTDDYFVNNGVSNVCATGTIGGLKILGGDYSGSGNTGPCIDLDGTAGIMQFLTISNTQIFPCGGAAIRVINSNAMTIANNMIGNPTTAQTVGTVDAIAITNYGQNAIVGNTIVDAQATPTTRYCISIAAETQPSSVVGNRCFINNAATTLLSLQANDPNLGNSLSNSSGVVSGTLGVSATKTVRDSAGTGTCTLIYSGGVLVGGSC